MNLTTSNILEPISPLSSSSRPKYLREASQSLDFSNTLKKALNKVNDAQKESDKKTEALAMGEIHNLHDVMIAAQKASVTLETTVQIQRKVIDAYNEIMRMQV
ncbi:flagellar hook-basal body complex protein FliE [Virgibacillus alimentarius]|uniref:Flagellar hook-basal body complex protein FliE n=1 Tax=Virgibacillus alimentarius TaxID=698769 RepID=A0ABS4S452_9BACI|nr:MULTISPECIES: flagellar hook-basal body complex protein FliE [Virgibacillus]MBP2256194.1 flagellar hook-basal body complex protein FliE [Virgibacillus alimentarius]HLR66141.1 flagellar hook-basal body complex protein FliE [Virgibacillus sp.]